MAYLTEEEINKVVPDGLEDSKKEEFVSMAEAVLDNVTLHFYRYQEINDDYPFRREQFKKALLSQIKYFGELGTSSPNEISSIPDSFSVGRTSISSSGNEGGSSPSLLAPDVMLYLEGTGLLYRGVN